MAYSASTIVGCFCLDAVVTSLQENGLVNGARQVATEQGAICTPFLKDYAKANAFKILAVRQIIERTVGFYFRCCPFSRRNTASFTESTSEIQLFKFWT